MTELKPCPFCGGTDITGRETKDGPVRPTDITCGDCGACSDVYNDIDEAITAWNRRANEARLREALERIAYGEPDYSVTAFQYYSDLARAALERT